MDIVNEQSYLNSFPALLAVKKVTLNYSSTIACPWLFMASLNTLFFISLGLNVFWLF